MPYPESCFTDLVAVRGTCEPQSGAYMLDDIPGIDLKRLAQLADADAPSGALLGTKLIETAARMMAADVEAIYDGKYKVENTLVNGCSTAKYNNNYGAGVQRGTMVKDNTESSFSKLVIDKLVAKTNQTGTFHIVLDDGDSANQRVIEQDFVAGDEYEFQGINYQTRRKSVRIYLQEDTVPLAQLSYKRGGSGCGCSGSTVAVANDLIYTGTLNGAETQQAYGFIPCAFIRCEAADLLCFIAHSAPRMIGMALLFKAAELYFDTKLQSLRNNKVAGQGTDPDKEAVTKYGKLYLAKLNGDKTRGVKDLVFTTLQQTSDVCVVCNALVGSAWATG